jgi:hypothetical protein
MASFVTELWESVFTPGTTPVLLKATNLTFAALQITLFALLIATYSVHFVALSILCAGLWWSINWFATELAAAKARGDIPSGNDDTDSDKKAHTTAAAKASGPPEGESSDTEVEGRSTRSKAKSRRKAAAETARADVEPVDVQGDVKHRGGADSRLSQSSVSTEDEWEKVSGSEQDKEK